MDCETFQTSEIAALYDELDAAMAAAMDEHASSCASCTARLARLRATRGSALPALAQPLPDGFEARLLAAVDAAILALPPTALPPAEAKAGATATGGARILRFLSRPQLAIAATLVLVLGGAGLFMSTSAKRSAPMAASPVAGGATPSEMAAPPAARPETETAATSMVALADEPAPAPAVMAAQKAKAGAGSNTKPSGIAANQDPAFVAAKKLYDAGRFAEALPRFDALATTNGEAELFAARCVARTRGCSDAAPRFDTVAQNNRGTETGSRATLEGARCYGSIGQPQAARARYQTLEVDGFVAPEAKRALEALDAKGTRANATAAAPPAQAAPARPPPKPADNVSH